MHNHLSSSVPILRMRFEKKGLVPDRVRIKILGPYLPYQAEERENFLRLHGKMCLHFNNFQMFFMITQHKMIF
jgi:hypothetical protein